MTGPVKKTGGAARDVSRRQFIQGVSAAASAIAIPCLMPAAVLGKGGTVAPSERIVLGGIGLGGRGTGDLNVMLSEPDVQFVAVCEVRKSRREAIKSMVDARYGTKDCATYSDMREFLAERTDVDAVLIATGDRWHAPASIMAMRAGKDVFCEKPSCHTMAQGRMVVETARNYGRIYQTGTQRLSEANHVFAIEMARTGRLGPIHTAYADIRWRDGNRHDWLPAEAEPSQEELDWDAWLGPCPWRPYNSGYMGGGWYHFYDFATDVAMWGAHTVAQVLPGLDMSNVSSIDFEYSSPDGPMEARLSNGVKLVLARGPGCNYWHGSCGERFDGPEDGLRQPTATRSRMFHPPPCWPNSGKCWASTQPGRNVRCTMRDFLNCVRSRRATVAGPEVMYNSMIICLAADICEQLQRNLRFDLRKAEFAGDPEANRLRSRAMRESWCV